MTSKANKKQSALIRNVLCLPFKQKWPLIKEEDKKELLPVLISCISPMKMDPPKEIKWSELKNLTKDERRSLKKERQNELSEEERKKKEAVMEHRNLVCCGINAVSKGVESDLVDFALIASDIEPRMLAKPLIQLLYTKEIPVLLIPDLKNISRESMGFNCIAFGFKKNEKFSELKTLVSKFFEVVKIKEEEIEKPEEENVKLDDVVEEEEPVAKTRKIDPEVDLSSVYVYKDSDHKSGSTEEPSGIIQVKTVSSQTEKLSKNARYYLPPVVNRVRSNPSKRRKIKK